MKRLQEIIGYTFSDVSLLETALTHSSWANENNVPLEHNERLEFLGDAVLELAISDELFRRLPTMREGDLTRMRSSLVSEPSLAALAHGIGLENFLQLGKGEESQGGRFRDTLLADAFEAILGGVFLDGGFEPAQQVIGHLFEERWNSLPKSERKKDHKTLLQEYTQRHFQARPTYTLLSSTGPEHAKIFDVKVDLPNGRSLVAQGGSMKRAEQEAARQALALLQEK